MESATRSVPRPRALAAIGLICAAMILAGVLLVLLGHSLPVFTVPYDSAVAADLARCDASARLDDSVDARYLAMFGWHYDLMNAGVSLAAAGITAGLLALALYRFPAPGMSWLRTPAHRWTFVAIGVGALAGTLAGISHGLYTDLTRHYFPWCADSIGIPIGGLIATAMVVAPVLALVGGLISLGFGTLPAPLTQWDASRPLWSLSVTLVFAAAMLGGTTLQALSLFSSDLTSPMSVAALYLLAATRAALLAPRKAGTAA